MGDSICASTFAVLEAMVSFRQLLVRSRTTPSLQGAERPGEDAVGSTWGVLPVALQCFENVVAVLLLCLDCV